MDHPASSWTFKFKFSAKEISSFVSLLKVLIRQTLANVFFTKACVLIIPTWAFSACFVSIQLVSSSALRNFSCILSAACTQIQLFAKSLKFHPFSKTNLYAQRVSGCFNLNLIISTLAKVFSIRLVPSPVQISKSLNLDIYFGPGVYLTIVHTDFQSFFLLCSSIFTHFLCLVCSCAHNLFNSIPN